VSAGHPLDRRVRRLAVAAWALAVSMAVAIAGAPASARAQGAPGEELEISVITMGQGDQVWERFGHNALWIRDRARGTDVAWNWGLFDFAAPDFVLRFVTGETRYWMAGHDVEATFALYRQLGRSITVQRLALTPAQRVAVRDYIEWNAREENKYYRYDYFLDNCSTRLRDVLDRALGGQLRRATEGTITNTSFRSESVRLTEGLAQAGITVALGQPADVPISAWQQMFVPMRLRDRLREVRVAGPGGTLVPLVTEERIEFTAARAPEPQEPPALFGTFALAGLLLAGLVAALGAAATREGAGHRAARIALAVIGAAWALAAAVAGLALVGAWAATHHIFWFRNENLLQLSPLALPLVVLVPLALYRPRWARAAFRVAATVAVIAVLALLLKALPWMRQDNLHVIALALPVHLALAWTLRRLPGAGGVAAAAR
jgi:hypothetical protein